MTRRRTRVVLTPEHVPLTLNPAGAGSRSLALLLDFAVVAALAEAVASVFSLVSTEIGYAARITALLFLNWGYNVYCETRRDGKTLGKRALGLRVVDSRGLPITFEQSFVRNIVRVLDFAPIFYGLGGCVALLDRDGRRLGDFLADTLVVHERVPLAPAGGLGGPRRHNALAQPALLGRIQHRVSLDERELLLALELRADRLDERARYDLMQEVADHYRKKLDIDDPTLSGENLVRDLVAVLWGEGDGVQRGRKVRLRSRQA